MLQIIQAIFEFRKTKFLVRCKNWCNYLVTYLFRRYIRYCNILLTKNFIVFQLPVVSRYLQLLSRYCLLMFLMCVVMLSQLGDSILWILQTVNFLLISNSVLPHIYHPIIYYPTNGTSCTSIQVLLHFSFSCKTFNLPLNAKCKKFHTKVVFSFFISMSLYRKKFELNAAEIRAVFWPRGGKKGMHELKLSFRQRRKQGRSCNTCLALSQPV